MIVAGSASPLLLASAGGYNLTRSLRTRGSASAYLNRTPASAGNRRTWTWSAWVKRGTLGATGQVLFSASNGSTVQFYLGFFSDNLEALNWAGSTQLQVKTTQVFRDTSAWYHIVLAMDTTQATASNRVRMYVNGVEVTSFSTASYPTQNLDVAVNALVSHSINREEYSDNQWFDGYLAETHFIDGQALTPSSFGANSPTTGVWQPKKYVGTYGTNGFYLPFTNNSTTTTLGNDFSGNGNNWTTNNISLTAGSTYDSMTDVPTLTSATAANFAVFNPIAPASQTLSNANLQASTASTAAIPSTILASSGKWYAEVTLVSGTYHRVGVCNSAGIARGLGDIADGWAYLSDARVYNNGATTSYGVSSTNGDIINVALDLDNGRVWYGKNGTWMASGDPATNSNPSQTFTANQTMAFAVASGSGTIVYTGNFGQRPFAYTPPTGFVALNTFNLPTPTIGATASTQANKYFDISLYTGTGSAQTITNSGGMQPDFVWGKARSTTRFHVLVDAVRGSSKDLYTNVTNAENTDATVITGFNSSGFNLGTDGELNLSANTFVAWQWKANGAGSSNTAGSITSTVSANTSAGFSIVTYTGTGANATVGHGLGVAPSMMIFKNRTSSSTWIVYHSSISPTNLLTLNQTAAQQNLPAYFNSTAPSSTVFSIGSNSDMNASGANQLAYCFSEVAGYSKFGSYTGNGSSDGTFVHTGFRPAFVIVKCSSSDQSGNAWWVMYDNKRIGYNSDNRHLGAQASDAEYTANSIDLLSNGFKLRDTNSSRNASGATYIYMAFAETPFRYSLGR